MRSRLFEMLVLADEVLLGGKISQREEKVLREQLKQIDVQE